jgi:hypothetical protein
MAITKNRFSGGEDQLALLAGKRRQVGARAGRSLDNSEML